MKLIKVMSLAVVFASVTQLHAMTTDDLRRENLEMARTQVQMVTVFERLKSNLDRTTEELQTMSAQKSAQEENFERAQRELEALQRDSEAQAREVSALQDAAREQERKDRVEADAMRRHAEAMNAIVTSEVTSKITAMLAYLSE